MKKTMSILTVCFLISFAGWAQSKEEKEVAARVETLRKAMVDADKAALENIAAEELSYGHSTGRIEDKAAFVDVIVSGKNDFVKIEVTDLTIKIVGNTAIVRHKLTGDTANDGKPATINLGLLMVWQKQKNEWKLLARQGFKL
jgi:ketosteroid isomerase-like protein